MFRACTLLAALQMVTGSSAQKATIFEAPQSDQRVSYVLHVSLDSEARTLHGAGQMTWRNPDVVPVDTLQFHMYLNAFKDEGSTFMLGRGGAPRSSATGSVWGRIEFTKLETAEGTSLMERAFFIQPDDGNADDATVAALVLPKPVMPGETVALSIAFTSQLPRILARTGYLERHDGAPFFMAAQWFPKFGVYEVPGQRYVPADAPRGRWNTHQFHAYSEFYADFGSYDVTIDVPSGYVIGASGVRTEAYDTEGRRTERYIAEDVHDFAWTASPAFLEFTETWRHVKLRLLLQPEHRGQARRHFDAARVALERYDSMVGVYPYTTLTLVDGLGQSNGMEYPTLITCGTLYQAPAWARLLELVLIHEFGHQYFYGLLASNEFEEAWLDEGINSYVEGKVMDDHFGAGSVFDIPGAPIGDAAGHRLLYAKDSPERGALFTNSWEYASSREYGKASYSKSATVLHTLEGYLGWPAMQSVLRSYYDRWRFRHPTTRDFQAVAEAVSGEDLAWFFDQYIYGTAVVDYAVGGLQVSLLEGGHHVARVRVERTRDGVFPQVVRAEFEDGTSEDRNWDGRASTQEFTFTHTAPVRYVRVDPDFLVKLDVNRLNNGMAAASSQEFARKHVLKFTVWMQYALRIAESLF